LFIVIVGAGKVGLNAARTLGHMGHEVVVVEQRRSRYNLLESELEDRIIFGDGTEMLVLEHAGIARADMVVAVTGDDEDNVIIAQMAKLKWDVPKVVARVNNPRNIATFRLVGVDAIMCAATRLISTIMHELPVHKFVPLLSLRRENLELVELEVVESSPFAGKAIEEIQLPEGVLLTAIIRGGEALLAGARQTLLAGDYILCLLKPGKERELIEVFLPEDVAEEVQAETDMDVIGEQ
jgi:trk system potassium uptake protein